MNKIIALLALLISSHSFAQTNSKLLDTKAVDSLLKSYCKPHEPGMALGIVKDGKVIYKKAVGTADLSHNIPISDSTVFNLASVSKHFTAFLALLAEEEGKFSLDDDIKKYLPELKHLAHKITIKQLANHSHGLPNYSEIVQLMGFTFQDPISNAFAVQAMLATKQVNFKPGSQFQYGNTGYMLLAEILTRVYEKPFPELAQEKLFRPLGMHQSTVVDHPKTIIKNKAQAYTRTSRGYAELANRQMECGSSNVHTSLTDLLKWVINFQKPTLGTPAQMKRLMTKTIALVEGGKVDYGLGLFTENYKGLHTVFHGGGTAGYRAYIMHVPEYNFSIVTLGNKEGFDGVLIIQELLKVYFGNSLKDEDEPQKTYTAEELKEFAGTYEFQPGQYWTIETDGENLFFNGDNQALPLIEGNNFSFFYIPTAHLTFLPNEMRIRIVDFIYSCKKVTLSPPDLDKEELKKFVGVYHNQEYNIFYEIILQENKLVIKHALNGEMPLRVLTPSCLAASQSFLGKIDFEFNTKGEAVAFILSGQNLKNIQFMKL